MIKTGDRITENGREGTVVAMHTKGTYDVLFDGADYAIRRQERSIKKMLSNPRRKKSKRKGLTKASRARLKASSFVFPRTRRYPINDLYHGQLALQYAQWPNNRKDLKKVKAAVFKKYPSLIKWWNKNHPEDEWKKGKSSSRRAGARRGRRKIAANPSGWPLLWHALKAPGMKHEGYTAYETLAPEFEWGAGMRFREYSKPSQYKWMIHPEGNRYVLFGDLEIVDDKAWAPYSQPGRRHGGHGSWDDVEEVVSESFPLTPQGAKQAKAYAQKIEGKLKSRSNPRSNPATAKQEIERLRNMLYSFPFELDKVDEVEEAARKLADSMIPDDLPVHVSDWIDQSSMSREDRLHVARLGHEEFHELPPVPPELGEVDTLIDDAQDMRYFYEDGRKRRVFDIIQRGKSRSNPRSNPSRRRQSLRTKYRKKHGDNWWKKKAIYARFRKELTR